MDPRAVGWTVLGMVALAMAAAFFFWPSSHLALTDRIPVGLLFAIPAVISFANAKHRF